MCLECYLKLKTRYFPSQLYLCHIYFMLSRFEILFNLLYSVFNYCHIIPYLLSMWHVNNVQFLIVSMKS